jgi:hypothetical protein
MHVRYSDADTFISAHSVIITMISERQSFYIWHRDKLFETYSNTKLGVFSPQANYIDRTTTACRRSQCQLLLIEGVAWSAQRIPTVV